MMLQVNKAQNKLEYENCLHTGKIILKIKDATILKNFYVKPINSCDSKEKLLRVETLIVRLKNYLNDGIKRQNHRMVNHCIHLLMIIISDVK